MGKSDSMFREDWSGVGKWAALARWMNSVGRCLNNLRGAKGVEVERNTAGGFDFYARAGGSGGGRGEVPPPPVSEGMYILVWRLRGDQPGVFTWEKVPSSLGGHNGMVPVFLVENSENGLVMDLNWRDESSFYEPQE